MECWAQSLGSDVQMDLSRGARAKVQLVLVEVMTTTTNDGASAVWSRLQ